MSIIQLLFAAPLSSDTPSPAPPPPPPPPPTPSPAVAISDQTALNYSQSGIGGSATATYRLGNDGIAKATNVSGVLTAITGEWLVTGSASDFEAYMSAAGGGSGGSTGGTFNSWVSLGTTRDWTLTATNNYAVRYLTLQIRVVATGTILDTATITLEVDSAP